MGSDEEQRALDAQVASGQLSIDEYLRRRAALTSGEPAVPAEPASSGSAAPSAAAPPFAPFPSAPPGAQPAPPIDASRPSFAAPPGATRQAPAQSAAPTSRSPLAQFPGQAAPFVEPAAGEPGPSRWSPPPPPQPGSGPGRTSRKSLKPWIAAAVLLAVILGGGLGFLFTRGGSDADDRPMSSTSGPSDPTPTPSTTTPNPPPPTTPFGTVAGATNTPSATGPATIEKALADNSMDKVEHDALAQCGAANGITQQLAATGWGGRGWVFACASDPKAEAALDKVADYYTNGGYTKIDAGRDGVVALRSSASPATVVVGYVSGNAVIFLAVTSDSQSVSLAQAKVLLGTIAPYYNSTYPD